MTAAMKRALAVGLASQAATHGAGSVCRSVHSQLRVADGRVAAVMEHPPEGEDGCMLRVMHHHACTSLPRGWEGSAGRGASRQPQTAPPRLHAIQRRTPGSTARRPAALPAACPALTAAGAAWASRPPDQQHLPELPEHHVGGLRVAVEVVLGGGRHVALPLGAAHHDQLADCRAAHRAKAKGEVARPAQKLQVAPPFQVTQRCQAACSHAHAPPWDLGPGPASSRSCVAPPLRGKLSSTLAASAMFVSGPVATTVSSPSCSCASAEAEPDSA